MSRCRSPTRAGASRRRVCPTCSAKFSRIDSGEPGGVTGLGLVRLQGNCGGPWGAHLGRKRRAGPGSPVHLHYTGGGAEPDTPLSPLSTRSLRSRSQRRRAADQVRVLAVDDDPQTLRHVREALVTSDYTPVVTADPKEALRLVEEEKPHLVLLDLVLPGDRRDCALMKDIAANGGRASHVFLSAHGQEQLVGQALDEGSRRLSGQALLAGGAGGSHKAGPAPAGDAGAVSALRRRRPDH